MKKQKIKIVLGFIFIVVLIVEISLRIFNNQKLAIRKLPRYVAHSGMGYMYEPNVTDYNCRPAFNNLYHTNSYGFVGRQFSEKKQEGFFRIMLLGNSLDVGFDSDGPDNYSTVLQKEFEKHNIKAEIINCAIDGMYRAKQNEYLIKEYCEIFQPDIILYAVEMPLSTQMEYRETYEGFVLSYYKNSQEVIKQLKTYVDENYIKRNAFTVLYNTSYISRKFFKYYAENHNNFTRVLSNIFYIDRYKITSYVSRIVSSEDNFRLENYSIEQSFEKYKELNNYLKERNIELVLFDKFQMNINVFKSHLFNSFNIKYLSLNLPSEESFSFGELDGHFTQYGHKKIAQQLYSDLFNGLLFKLNKSEIESVNFPNTVISNKHPFTAEIKSAPISSSSINNYTSDSEYFNILFFYNAFNPEVAYYDSTIARLNSQFQEIGDKVVIKPYKLHKYRSIHEYLNQVDSIVKKTNAELILSYVPTKLIADSIEESICLLDQYRLSFQKEGAKFYFYNISSSNQYVDYIFRLNSIESISANIDVYWDRVGHGKDWALDLKYRILPSYFYTELTSNHIPDRYLNRVRNVALNKKVVPSSSPERDSWFVNRCVDGIRPWCTNSRGWRSVGYKENENRPEWITIDLNSEFSLQKVIIYPRDEKEHLGNGFPIDFTIQVSSDSIRWDTVVTKTKYPKPINGKPQIFNFTASEVRFVKFEGTKLSKDVYFEEGAKYVMSFSEIEVYGTEKE